MCPRGKANKSRMQDPVSKWGQMRKGEQYSEEDWAEKNSLLEVANEEREYHPVFAAIGALLSLGNLKMTDPREPILEIQLVM